MARKAPVLIAHAELPHDLYRGIIENLDHPEEKDTLLCLALVSKAWCAESQRVLFRSVCNDSMDLDKRESLIHTHMLFLKAIILNPTRLGPHVQAYKQRELIYHPVLAMDSKHPTASASSYLWDLTAEALPAFVNLKHLFIVPAHRTPGASLLNGCTFKLESLRWGFESSNTSRTNHAAEFLRTQHGLLHLEIGYYPLREDFSWLADNVCPKLMSTACQLDSAAGVMAKLGKIVGLTTHSDWNSTQSISQSHLSALRCLKYLSISAPRDLMPHSQTAAESRAVLLEITSWGPATIQNLPSLPNLRVLALIRAARDAPVSTVPFNVSMDVKAEYNLRIQLTMESFRRYPSLEYVIIEDMPRGEGPRRFRKLSLSGLNHGPDSTPDIQSEEFPIERELGIPWWAAYGV